MAERTREKTTLIEVVLALDDEALTEMWLALDVWEWPEMLPEGFKPDWWDGGPAFDAEQVMRMKMGFSGPLMEHAAARIGRDTLLEVWHSREAP